MLTGQGKWRDTLVLLAHPVPRESGAVDATERPLLADSGVRRAPMCFVGPADDVDAAPADDALVEPLGVVEAEYLRDCVPVIEEAP